MQTIHHGHILQGFIWHSNAMSLMYSQVFCSYGFSRFWGFNIYTILWRYMRLWKMTIWWNKSYFIKRFIAISDLFWSIDVNRMNTSLFFLYEITQKIWVKTKNHTLPTVTLICLFFSFILRCSAFIYRMYWVVVCINIFK